MANKTPRSAEISAIIDDVATLLNRQETRPPPKAYVIDRKGRRVPPRWDKITERVEELCIEPPYGSPLPDIDAPTLTQIVSNSFKSGMSTREIDEIVVRTCAARGIESDQWLMLAARICISDLHKRTPVLLTEMLEQMAASPEGAARVMSRLSGEYIGIVKRFGNEINARLDVGRDYRLRIFGFQTLARSYLLRSHDRVAASTMQDPDGMLMERPMHMYMRIALIIFCATHDHKGHLVEPKKAQANLETALSYYDALSKHEVSHASPTILNAGTNRQQLSSCFQLATGDDMDALLKTVLHAGQTSKWAGGMSCSLSVLRAEGAHIHGTGGKSSGIGRYLQLLNSLILYVNQGGNRPGALAVYMEPWHADIFTMLRMARMDERFNAPDLKYALWATHNFVDAVINDGDWYLMSPDESPGLHLKWGAEFEKLYNGYVAAGKYRHKIKARDILVEMTKTVNHVGNPYALLKDNVNMMSNMKNVGTICSSNLCAEITIPSFCDADAVHYGRPAGEGEYGVCNLGAICLESFVEEGPVHELLFHGRHYDIAKIIAAQALSPKAEAIELFPPLTHEQMMSCTPTGVVPNLPRREAHLRWTCYGETSNTPAITDIKDTKTAAPTASAKPKIEIDVKKPSGPYVGHPEGEPDNLFDFNGSMHSAMVDLVAHMRATGVWIDFRKIIARATEQSMALNRLIDITYSPTSAGGEAADPGARSNRRHRPIAVGMMGLADVIMRLDLVYGEPRALAAARAIAAAIYYGAMVASSYAGEVDGPYPSFYENGGCPASKGMLQPDIWVANGKYNAEISPDHKFNADEPQPWERELEPVLGELVDWVGLRKRLKKGWLRNAYVTACMPTATTSNIVGQNESFEPFTANIYPRSTLAGEHVMISRHMERDLRKIGKWSESMRKRIIANRGSVRGLTDDLSLHLRRKYRAAREIDIRTLMFVAKMLAPFVSQSMSLNGFDSAPTVTTLLTRLKMAKDLGLPIAWYYIHSTPAKLPTDDDSDDEVNDDDDDKVEPGGGDKGDEKSDTPLMNATASSTAATPTIAVAAAATPAIPTATEADTVANRARSNFISLFADPKCTPGCDSCSM